MKRFIPVLLLVLPSSCLLAEDGYRLWLGYDKIDYANLLRHYRKSINSIHFSGFSATLTAAKDELSQGCRDYPDTKINEIKERFV